MGFSLIHYSKIKDKICLYYDGFNQKYIDSIIELIPSIKQNMPELEIWLSSKNININYDKTINYDYLNDEKYNFGYIFNLKDGLNIKEIF